MAGSGSRFLKQGFELPKPLIPVDGIPMVVRAIQCMPQGEKKILIVQKEHATRFDMVSALEPYFDDINWIYVDGLTDGQASTCLLAKDLINNDEPLFIGACDNGMFYDDELFHSVSEICDVIIFTFRNSTAASLNPSAYGWVNTIGDRASSVSVKVAISDNPISDPAIVGAFWFKRGSDFVTAAEDMINQNRRINNEFYVDECINNLIAGGADVRIFDITEYIGWGTPEDYQTYHYWSSYFSIFPSI
jgi:dTDP-glucose pyrophosphorylase